MFKRGCFLGVLSILSCMLISCDSDNAPKDQCEVDSDCLDFTLDTRRGCYLISGVRVCQNSCLARDEGDNAPVCYQPLSAASEPEPTVSVTDTCAKDEEGRLYSLHSERELCSNYCNKKTGLCKKPCDLDCTVYDGRSEACFIISGVPTCKQTCLAIIAGKNNPVCYLAETIAPADEPDYSVVDTCAKDDNGSLYSVDTEYNYCEDRGCDKATGLCKEALNCCQDAPDGDRANICVSISGEMSCKFKCLAKSDGKSEPFCHSFAGAPKMSIVEECAKDDLGQLYSVETTENSCENGCNEDTGLCNGKDEPEESCTKDVECAWPDYDFSRGCFTIQGKSVCKNACLSDGTQKPMCYLLGGMVPDYKPMHSAVEFCAQDDNGKLYMTDIAIDDCEHGCDEATGLCKKGEDPATACNEEDEKQCNPPGGDPQVCTVISGKKGCKDICHGNAVGKNAAVCYVNGSLDPSVAPQYSIVSTCKKDDNGTLYSAQNTKNECPNGCDEATGLCKDAPVTCKKDCSLDGGDPRVCVVISGKESCATACFGKAEGKNDPVCYQNGSIGPQAPYYSIIDTCKKDDIGTLYSDGNEERTKCDNGCDEKSGLCKSDKPVSDCEANCGSFVGARPKTCVVISGKEDCRDKCFGDKEGENAPICYKNGSTDPSVTPYYSLVDHCAKDDNGKLYSDSTDKSECSGDCDNTSGLCK
ncbi:MAG: hypothetical protein J6A01_04340 [Proteobacteria bacterium]|nr:hypothetical protein [Pseudomonadota bacterium]